MDTLASDDASIFIKTFGDDQDGWRWYTLSDGRKLISVTESMDHIVPMRLKKMMRRDSENKQKKRLKETGDIGKDIEQLIYKDLTGQENVIPDQYQKPFENWLRLKELHKIKATIVQKQVWSEKYGFAGTLDIMGPFTSCENKHCCFYQVEGDAVMDVKTGFISTKAAQQEAAYDQGLTEWGVAGNRHLVTIAVHRDGLSAKMVVTSHKEEVLMDYLHALETFKATYHGKLKQMKWPWLYDDATMRYLRDRWGLDEEKYYLGRA